MRARLLLILLAIAGAIEIALAVQIVDQGDPEPCCKLFVLGWLETQVWVDVRLFLAGMTSVLLAVAAGWWVVRNHRRAAYSGV